MRISDNKTQTGFIALTAVIILAVSTLVFASLLLGQALSYSDSVNRHEYRIQAGLNARACLDYVTLMTRKDFFLNGEVEVPEFGCVANATNDFNGNFSIKVKAVFNGVSVFLEV